MNIIFVWFILSFIIDKILFVKNEKPHFFEWFLLPVWIPIVLILSLFLAEARIVFFQIVYILGIKDY